MAHIRKNEVHAGVQKTKDRIENLIKRSCRGERSEKDNVQFISKFNNKQIYVTKNHFDKFRYIATIHEY